LLTQNIELPGFPGLVDFQVQAKGSAPVNDHMVSSTKVLSLVFNRHAGVSAQEIIFVGLPTEVPASLGAFKAKLVSLHADDVGGVDIEVLGDFEIVVVVLP